MQRLYTIEYDRIPQSLWGAPVRRSIDDLLPGRAHLYFALGRSALLWLCRAAGWGQGDHVLMPALICDSAIAPFRRAGLNIEFYLTRPDLTIDDRDLERRLRPATRAALIVHYFGWPQPFTPIRRLRARAPEVVWIEDVCHALLTDASEGRLGHTGDVALASFRKLFPCPDGAVLAHQAPPPSHPVSSLPSARYRAHALGRLSAMTVAGRVVHDDRHSPVLLRRTHLVLKRWRAGSPQVDGMHPASRGLVERFDCRTAVQTRRMNAEHLIRLLRDRARVDLPFAQLEAGVVPMGLPILVANPSRVQATLWASGVEALRLWPAPQGLPEADASAMRHLHERLLCLPVREPYTRQDMEYIARAVSAAVESTSRSD